MVYLTLLTSNTAEIDVNLNVIVEKGFCVNGRGKGTGRGRTVNNELLSSTEMTTRDVNFSKRELAEGGRYQVNLSLTSVDKLGMFQQNGQWEQVIL